ncbi:MAG: hypothetical protein MJE77_28365 [Proteobacteria bacterium]|nr:hypothetical protein [Pseudomonadota bacterium]
MSHLPHGSSKVPRMLRRPGPQAELESVLAQSAAVRKESLIKLAERHPKHAPIWMALAEEHLAARRKEEALHAAQSAFLLDRVLYRHFSPALKRACEGFLPDEDESANPGNARLESDQPRATPVVSRYSKSRRGGQMAAQIAKIRALENPERHRKLQELTRQHPDQGQVWLAMAEEQVKARRIEEAMAALERALVLDPSLEDMLSRDLLNAQRYHKAGISAGDTLPQSQHGPTIGPAGRTDDSGPPAGHSDTASSNPESARLGPSVGSHLALALEVENRARRLEALEALREMAPDDSAVLFHYALESALAGKHDQARQAGKQLQRISPERYKQLYEVAQAYWPCPDDREAADDDRALSQMGDPLDEEVQTALIEPVAVRSPVRLTEVLHSEPLGPTTARLPPVPAPLPASPAGRFDQATGYSADRIVSRPSAPLRSDRAGDQPSGFSWRAVGMVGGAVAAGVIFALLVALFLSLFDSADTTTFADPPERLQLAGQE